MSMRGLPYVLISIAALAIACGDDDGSDAVDAATSADAPAIDGSIVADAVVPDADPAAPDAEPGAPDARLADANVDAKVSPVEIIDCTGVNVDVSVTTSGRTFVLSSTDPIPVRGVARFSPGGSHDATSGANRTADGLFAVAGGATVCIRFLEAGTFPFYCTIHNPMEGALTVAVP
jgi:hypothetical protein